MSSLTIHDHQTHDAVTAALVAALPTEQPLEMMPQKLEPARIMTVLGQIFAFLRPGTVRGAGNIIVQA